MKVELVCDHSCLLGEGPVWNGREKKICWVDILNGEIHEYDVVQKKRNTISVHQMVGAIAPEKNAHYVAALQHGLGFINRQTGEVKMIADPEADIRGNRFNDGKCDPAGRFWAGTMPLSEDSPAGNVYSMDGHFSIQKKISGVTVSNGMAWSLDRHTLYYIDSPSHEVVSYTYDEVTGNISDKKRIIEIVKEEGSPDGMTIDGDGMLWIAHWGGWKLSRWDPDAGKKIDELIMPVSKVTSCTFGGDHGDDLYVTSARVDLTEKELEKQPLAGSLFVIRNSGFSGMPCFEFAGGSPWSGPDKK